MLAACGGKVAIDVASGGAGGAQEDAGGPCEETCALGTLEGGAVCAGPAADRFSALLDCMCQAATCADMCPYFCTGEASMEDPACFNECGYTLCHAELLACVNG
jgi:hypothetical protein